jgi:hypothetical protein
MIQDLIELSKSYLLNWHQKNLTWFNLEDHLQAEDKLEYFVIKNAYHNYCMWHFIEYYKNPDTGLALFVYDGGLEHNKDRNQSIELMDDKFMQFQKNTGKINSETLGSIIDRLNVLYIKHIHLKESQDPRLETLMQQTKILEACAKELLQDMIDGTRQCMPLGRFKTNGY